MSTATAQARGPVDLRLAPGAIAVWLTTLLFLQVAARVVWVGVAVLVLVAGALVLAGRHVARARWLRGALAASALAVAAAGGVAIRQQQAESHPLAGAAQQGVSAQLRVSPQEPPTPLRGPSYGSRRSGQMSLLRADVRSSRVRGARWRGGGEVLLLVPTSSWANVRTGAEIVTHGKLRPPRGGELLAAVVMVRGPPRTVARAPVWQRAAEHMRAGLRDVAHAVLDPAAAGLLPGIVIGDTSGQDQRVDEEFRAAGMTHLVAVSGANLAIVSGAVLLLCRLLRLGPGVSAVSAGIALLGFVLLTGGEPSVLRAAVMGAITLLALVSGKQRSALPALSTAVIVLVLADPELATNAAFALSVLATAALVLLAPGWARWLRGHGVPAGLAEAITVPAAAELVTAPIVAAISGHLSVLSVPANLLVEPVVAPATVLGVLATALAPLWPSAAHLFVWMSGPELEWMLFVAHHIAAVPGALLDWPSGMTGGLLLATALTLAIVALRSRRFRWLAAALVIGIVVVLVPVRLIAPGWPPAGWSLVSCDVGQGDGLVLATARAGEAVVVDTGPDPGEMTTCLRRLGVRRVPLVVLTHPHADHIGGLAGVLADDSVGAVATGHTAGPTWATDQVRRQTREAGTPMVRLTAGQRIRLPGLMLEVLGPVGAAAHVSAPDEANDSSVILRAHTPAGRVLLTGDAELLAQSALLSAGADLSAEVLKVPHHGSRSSSPQFFAAVHPRLSVISVGAGNEYGHPNPHTTGALRRLGSRVVRTDRRGDIAVLSGAQGLSVTWRGDPRPPPD